jgi:drug/metabolite transporter (DMT)-like permease
VSVPPRSAYAALIAVCVIWGTTYLAIRISLEAVPPAILGGIRWIVAGTVLAVITRARGERLPGPSAWGDLIVQGLLLLGLGNGGVNWAEQYVPSGLAAVMIATVPFFMVGVDRFFPGGEHITREVLFGLIVGFSGILLLVWPDLTVHDAAGAHFAWGVVSLQVACLGWAIGSSYSKRHKHGGSVLGMTAVQMLAGGVAMMVVGTVIGEWPQVHLAPRGVVAIAYLIVVGSLGGFVSYIYALKHLPVRLVSIYAYVNPLIAVVLGALVASEPFDLRTVAAMAIVFAGIALVRGGAWINRAWRFGSFRLGNVAR